MKKDGAVVEEAMVNSEDNGEGEREREIALCGGRGRARGRQPALPCKLPLSRIPDFLQRISAVPTERLMCLFCERTFGSGVLLQKHTERSHRLHSKRRSSARIQEPSSSPGFHPGCNLCSRTTSVQTSANLPALFHHLVDNHAQRYFACRVCKLRFSTPVQLEQHNSQRHPALDPAPADAPNCESVQTPPSDNVKSNSPPKRVTLSLPSENSNNDLPSDNVKRDSRRRNLERSKLPKQISKPAVSDTRQNLLKSAPTTNAPLEDDELEDFEDNIVANFIIPTHIKEKNLPNRKVNINQKELSTDSNKKISNVNNASVSIARMQIKPDSNDTQMLSRLGLTQNRSPRAQSLRRSRRTPLTESRASSEITRKEKLKQKSESDFVINKSKNEPGSKFDPDFYSTVASNVRENLLKHLDGKLGKSNVACDVPEMIDPKIKSTHAVVQFTPDEPAEIHGSDINLNAITVFPTLLTSDQYGSDKIPHYSYGAKVQTFKKIITKNSWKWKWDPIKKYKYCNENGKIVRKIRPLQQASPRDLSKLDIWTQLSMREKYDKFIGNKDINTPSEGDKYRIERQKQINELNRILDSRVFPDIDQECSEVDVASKEDVEAEVGPKVEAVKQEEVEPVAGPSGVRPEKELQNNEVLNALGLSSVSNSTTDPPAVLSGEWARPRCYVCCVCGRRAPCLRLLEAHQASQHPHVHATYYELVGKDLLQTQLYKHLYLPIGKKTLTGVEKNKLRKQTIARQIKNIPRRLMSANQSTRILRTTTRTIKSLERECTKCKKMLSPSELYRHVLECAGDYGWIMAKKKCKYKPFGARRRRLKGLYKRERPQEEEEKSEMKSRSARPKLPSRPRTKPSDAETIQRMLANLPAKRASRQIMSLPSPKIRPYFNNQSKPGHLVRRIVSSANMQRKKVLGTSTVITTVKDGLGKKLRRVTRSFASSLIQGKQKLKSNDLIGSANLLQNRDIPKRSQSSLKGTNQLENSNEKSSTAISKSSAKTTIKRQLSSVKATSSNNNSPKHQCLTNKTLPESLNEIKLRVRKSLPKNDVLPVATGKGDTQLRDEFKKRILRKRLPTNNSSPESKDKTQDIVVKDTDQIDSKLNSDNCETQEPTILSTLQKSKKSVKKVLAFPLKWIGNKRNCSTKSKLLSNSPIHMKPEEIQSGSDIILTDDVGQLNAETPTKGLPVSSDVTDSETPGSVSNEGNCGNSDKIITSKEAEHSLMDIAKSTPYSVQEIEKSETLQEVNINISTELSSGNQFKSPDLPTSILVASNMSGTNSDISNFTKSSPNMESNTHPKFPLPHGSQLTEELKANLANKDALGVYDIRTPYYPPGSYHTAGKDTTISHFESSRQPNKADEFHIDNIDKPPLFSSVSVLHNIPHHHLNSSIVNTSYPSFLVNDLISSHKHSDTGSTTNQEVDNYRVSTKSKAASKSKRGLDDCIAMLKGKLCDKVSINLSEKSLCSTTNNVANEPISVSCDEILQPLDLSGRCMQPEDLSVISHPEDLSSSKTQPQSLFTDCTQVQDLSMKSVFKADHLSKNNYSNLPSTLTIRKPVFDPTLRIPQFPGVNPSISASESHLIKSKKSTFSLPISHAEKKSASCVNTSVPMGTKLDLPHSSVHLPSTITHELSLLPQTLANTIEKLPPLHREEIVKALPQVLAKAVENFNLIREDPTLINFVKEAGDQEVNLCKPGNSTERECFPTKHSTPPKTSETSTQTVLSNKELVNESCPPEFLNVNTDLFLIDPISGMITERKIEEPTVSSKSDSEQLEFKSMELESLEQSKTNASKLDDIIDLTDELSNPEINPSLLKDTSSLNVTENISTKSDGEVSKVSPIPGTDNESTTSKPTGEKGTTSLRAVRIKSTTEKQKIKTTDLSHKIESFLPDHISKTPENKVSPDENITLKIGDEESKDVNSTPSIDSKISSSKDMQKDKANDSLDINLSLESSEPAIQQDEVSSTQHSTIEDNSEILSVSDKSLSVNDQVPKDTERQFKIFNVDSDKQIPINEENNPSNKVQDANPPPGRTTRKSRKTNNMRNIQETSVLGSLDLSKLDKKKKEVSKKKKKSKEISHNLKDVVQDMVENNVSYSPDVKNNNTCSSPKGNVSIDVDSNMGSLETEHNKTSFNKLLLKESNTLSETALTPSNALEFQKSDRKKGDKCKTSQVDMKDDVQNKDVRRSLRKSKTKSLTREVQRTLGKNLRSLQNSESCNDIDLHPDVSGSAIIPGESCQANLGKSEIASKFAEKEVDSLLSNFDTTLSSNLDSDEDDDICLADVAKKSTQHAGQDAVPIETDDVSVKESENSLDELPISNIIKTLEKPVISVPTMVHSLKKAKKKSNKKSPRKSATKLKVVNTESLPSETKESISSDYLEPLAGKKKKSVDLKHISEKQVIPLKKRAVETSLSLDELPIKPNLSEVSEGTRKHNKTNVSKEIYPLISDDKIATINSVKLSENGHLIFKMHKEHKNNAFGDVNALNDSKCPDGVVQKVVSESNNFSISESSKPEHTTKPFVENSESFQQVNLKQCTDSYPAENSILSSTPEQSLKSVLNFDNEKVSAYPNSSEKSKDTEKENMILTSKSTTNITNDDPKVSVKKGYPIQKKHLNKAKTDKRKAVPNTLGDVTEDENDQPLINFKKDFKLSPKESDKSTDTVSEVPLNTDVKSFKQSKQHKARPAVNNKDLKLDNNDKCTSSENSTLLKELETDKNISSSKSKSTSKADKSIRLEPNTSIDSPVENKSTFKKLRSKSKRSVSSNSSDEDIVLCDLLKEKNKRGKGPATSTRSLKLNSSNNAEVTNTPSDLTDLSPKSNVCLKDLSITKSDTESVQVFVEAKQEDSSISDCNATSTTRDSSHVRLDTDEPIAVIGKDVYSTKKSKIHSSIIQVSKLREKPNMSPTSLTSSLENNQYLQEDSSKDQRSSSTISSNLIQDIVDTKLNKRKNITRNSKRKSDCIVEERDLLSPLTQGSADNEIMMTNEMEKLLPLSSEIKTQSQSDVTPNPKNKLDSSNTTLNSSINLEVCVTPINIPIIIDKHVSSNDEQSVMKKDCQDILKERSELSDIKSPKKKVHKLDPCINKVIECDPLPSQHIESVRSNNNKSNHDTFTSTVASKKGKKKSIKKINASSKADLSIEDNHFATKFNTESNISTTKQLITNTTSIQLVESPDPSFREKNQSTASHELPLAEVFGLRKLTRQRKAIFESVSKNMVTKADNDLEVFQETSQNVNVIVNEIARNPKVCNLEERTNSEIDNENFIEKSTKDSVIKFVGRRTRQVKQSKELSHSSYVDPVREVRSITNLPKEGNNIMDLQVNSTDVGELGKGNPLSPAETCYNVIPITSISLESNAKTVKPTMNSFEFTDAGDDYKKITRSNEFNENSEDVNRIKENFESNIEYCKFSDNCQTIDRTEDKSASKFLRLSQRRKTLASCEYLENEQSSVINETEDNIQEKYLADFGMFTEKRPRKSTLLAIKKISQTFKPDTSDTDEFDSNKNNKGLRKKGFPSKRIRKPSEDQETEANESYNSSDVENNVKKLTHIFNESTTSQSSDKFQQFDQSANTDDGVSFDDSNSAKDVQQLGNNNKVENYCTICKRKFRRPENLHKHTTTLMHISKLSEMEAKELENRLAIDTPQNSNSNIPSGDANESEVESQVSFINKSAPASSALSFESNVISVISKLESASSVTNVKPNIEQKLIPSKSSLPGPSSIITKAKSIYDQCSSTSNANFEAESTRPHSRVVSSAKQSCTVIKSSDNINRAYKSLAERKSFDNENVLVEADEQINKTVPISQESSVDIKNCHPSENITVAEPIPKDADTIPRITLSSEQQLFFECCNLLKESHTHADVEVSNINPSISKVAEVVSSVEPGASCSSGVNSILKASEIIPNDSMSGAESESTSDFPQTMSQTNLLQSRTNFMYSHPSNTNSISDFNNTNLDEQSNTLGQTSLPQNRFQHIRPKHQSDKFLRGNDELETNAICETENSLSQHVNVDGKCLNEFDPYSAESLMVRTNSDDFSDNGDSMLSSHETEHSAPIRSSSSIMLPADKSVDKVNVPMEFEDKFDKIKRKAREKAQAAQEAMSAVILPRAKKSSKKSSSKSKKMNDRKSLLDQNVSKSKSSKQRNLHRRKSHGGSVQKVGSKKILTKGALKGFDGVKVSLSSEEINFLDILDSSKANPPEGLGSGRDKSNVPLSVVKETDKRMGKIAIRRSLAGNSSSKRTSTLFVKKSECKNRSRNLQLEMSKRDSIMSYKSVENDKHLDIYEFFDDEDDNMSDKFKFRTPATMKSKPLMLSKVLDLINTSSSSNDRFHHEVHNDDSQISSLSFSDRDDFTYMSDDYLPNDSEDETNQSSISLDTSNALRGNKKLKKVLKQRNINKSAIMGKIFKNNAIRNDHNTSMHENIEHSNDVSTLGQADLDTLFDSLLDQNVSNLCLKSGSLTQRGKSTSMERRTDTEDDNEGESGEENGSIHGVNRAVSNVMSPSLCESDSENEESHLSPIRPYHRVSQRKIVPRLKARSSDDETIVKPESSKLLGKKSEIGVASHKSQRKCTTGKQNVLVESWSSESDYEDFRQFEEYSSIPRPQRHHRRPRRSGRHRPNEESKLPSEQPIHPPSERLVDSSDSSNILRFPTATSSSERKHKEYSLMENGKKRSNYHLNDSLNADSPKRHISYNDIGRANISSRRVSFNTPSSFSKGRSGRRKRRQSQKPFDYDDEFKPARIAEPLATQRRNKRAASEMLYYWSSSSDDDGQNTSTDVNSREPEHIEQHGWIVGDSHKKLVTMLAHAKGRKLNDNSSVKEKKSRPS